MQFTGQLSALRHRQFLKYWVGSFTSVGATQLQVMGLGWLVYELSESTIALGYLGVAAGLPAILTTLFGGVFADRFDKRLLLMITSLATAVLLALLAYLDYTQLAEVWHVLLITAGISIVTGFDWPVRQAIFPALIEREDMMSAVALTTIIWQACRMVMPAFGGLVIAFSDTWLLFVLCSLGFFAMYLVMLDLEFTSVISEARQSTLHQIMEGVEFIFREKIFLLLLGLSYGIFFFVSSYIQLMPAFTDMLAVGETGYGYLLSAVGLGSVTGTILSSTLQSSHRLGWAMLYGALLFGISIYGFAAASASNFSFAFYIALLMTFLGGVFLSVFMITSTTVMQLQVPDELRGRVMGFHAITYNLLPLGGLFSGYIASVSNPAIAVAISVSIFVGLLVWVMVSQPQLRAIDGTAYQAEAP